MGRYGEDAAAALGGENKPRILLMGLRRYGARPEGRPFRGSTLTTRVVRPCRSGKSSIQKVVFHKMSPNETLFLESTSKVIKNGNMSTLRSARRRFALAGH